MRHIRLSVTLFLLFIAFSCKKDFSRQPVVSTGDFDLAAAIAHGTLVDIGTKEIIDHGFCWDSVGEPTLGNASIRLGSLTTTGSFQAQLNKLSANKTYFLKAFISFSDEVLFGAMVTFTTPDLPIVTTTPMTEITETFARCGGEITDDYGSPVLARGVCWGIDSNPDTTGYHTSDGTGTGVFESVLTSLSPNTQYYVRAYATSIYGTRYANEVEFNTGQSATTPFVSTTVVSDITQTTAASGGNVVADGGYNVTVRGVCWSTTPYPTTADSKTEDGIGEGVFASSLTGLTANTTYYVRAYATNSVGTAYGNNQETFTTLQTINLPTVIIDSVRGITQTTIIIYGNVTSSGGATVTARGVCWNTFPTPTLSNNYTTNGSGTGTFVSYVTELTPNTSYYIRVYATNSIGTGYGNEINFTTGQTTTSPTVTTDDVTNITQTTASSGGNVTSDGGAAVTVRGVCWSTSQNPTTADNLTTDGSGIGTFISSLSALTANTTYYVRAYATNSAGTSYGNQKSFTTLPDVTVPTVSTAPVTNVTTNTATSGGTVTDDGGAFVSARGVCWNTSQNPTLADPYTTDGTGTGSYVSQLTGLTSNTTYYVRAYATNSAGTTYGNQQTFTTLQDPVLATVTTDDATDITQTTATSGGNVVSDGGATVTVRGVCWSTSSNPTTANSFTTDGSGIGAFVSYLTGLTPNTFYYVRAYATNSVGTAYGNEITFTTLSNITLPTVTTNDATDITQTTATSGGNVTSDGGGTVTARGVCWSTSSNPTLSDSYTTDGSGLGAFVSYITGLTANTMYYVRAYATNSMGTAYGNEVSFTTLAQPWQCGDSITVIHSVSGGVAPVDKTVTYGTATNIPGEPSKCWITSNLGADHQATAVNDATEASAGWYWQFNRKQGYKHDGIIRTPNTTWISLINENTDWTAANDPCTLELGSGWRIPTKTEWENVDASGGWTNWNGPWNSGLKMHAAGILNDGDGVLNSRGSTGLYSSSTQGNTTNCWTLLFYSTTCDMNNYTKANGYSLRCIKD